VFKSKAPRGFFFQIFSLLLLFLLLHFSLGQMDSRSKLKKKLRDAQRLLKRVFSLLGTFAEEGLTHVKTFIFSVKDNLPADVKVDTERKIKALQAQLDQTGTVTEEKKLSKRYHKIKFFGKF